MAVMGSLKARPGKGASLLENRLDYDDWRQLVKSEVAGKKTLDMRLITNTQKYDTKSPPKLPKQKPQALHQSQSNTVAT